MERAYDSPGAFPVEYYPNVGLERAGGSAVHPGHLAKEAEFHDQSASSLVPASNGAVEHVAIPNGVLETDGVRSQETDSPPPQLSDEKRMAIVKQVEFYFSDENLSTDKFMKQKLRAGGPQGWVHLQVIASFNKMKKLSKDVRAIAMALERSEEVVVEKKGSKQFRVRRKIPFKFPDKEGASDIAGRTVVAVNIPADSSIESLTTFFSACGTVEVVRIVHKNDPKNKDVQPPPGASRDLYATCQFSSAEEAIKAVNELTDRKSWRGGLRVTLSNGMTAEKATAKLKSSAGKKANGHKNDPEGSRSPPRAGSHSPHPEGPPRKRNGGHTPSPSTTGSRRVRDGQARSRSLTELELENAAASAAASSSNPEAVEMAHKPMRKPRSESNVEALFKEDNEGRSPPRPGGGGHGDRLPLRGVIQSISDEGWSYIKRDGGSRRNGRLPFKTEDALSKDGEPQTLHKGDHVEFRTWRDQEGTLMAVRVEKVKEKPRPSGSGAAGVAGTQWRTDRATQAHFRMAIGPDEGSNGFAAGRGRRIDPTPGSLSYGAVKVLKGGATSTAGLESSCDAREGAESEEKGGVIRRVRGSSMGGPDSKVFVPATGLVPDPSQFQDAD